MEEKFFNCEAGREIVLPRETPDRDSRYMGLAWTYAAFSKDPRTQVGAQIVAPPNYPLGGGYNGPPENINDRSFSWCRPDPDHPEELSKYDIVVHAEVNAIDHSDREKLPGSTIYVTGFPCKHCMREIVRKKIARVVYMEYPGVAAGGNLSDPSLLVPSRKLAELAGVHLEKFQGSLLWLPTWVEHLRSLGIYEERT